MLLFKDAIRLFAAYNEGIINLLGKYYCRLIHFIFFILCHMDKYCCLSCYLELPNHSLGYSLIVTIYLEKRFLFLVTRAKRLNTYFYNQMFSWMNLFCRYIFMFFYVSFIIFRDIKIPLKLRQSYFLSQKNLTSSQFTSSQFCNYKIDRFFSRPNFKIDNYFKWIKNLFFRMPFTFEAFQECVYSQLFNFAQK